MRKNEYSMKKKLLTVAIPAYNAEKYLHKCLDSFLLDASCLDALEILIVNDGSTDGTYSIAKDYEAHYPHTVRVIDKENGGHGSGINISARQASGKYYKVIDADDWIITENLPEFLARLQETEADVVLTHFHTVHMLDGTVRPFQTEGLALNQLYLFEVFWSAGKGVRHCCCFHGICYRTDFYRKSGVILSEKVFYEDQEYATLPFHMIQTILPLDLFLYQYMIGNAEQSVSDGNQVKRIDQLEKVLLVIVSAYGALPLLQGAQKNYFSYKIQELLLSYYTTALLKDPDRDRGRANARRIRALWKRKHVDLYKATTFQYDVCWLLSLLGVSGGTMEKYKKFRVYQRVRKMMH